MPSKRRRYSTGDRSLDQAVSDIVESIGGDSEPELIRDILMTGVLLGRDGAPRLDLKIINAALKEMRYAFKVFRDYSDIRKVSVFGSSRSRPGEADYEQAKAFGKLIAARDWMVVTGAGPGSMEAANEGAGATASFGVNIRLPFEAEPNPVIAEDPKLINFKYFFTRKLLFMKEASAYVLVPGGLGTMDETFEVLTLMQTGKSDIEPIVLLDPPGGTFWSAWRDLVRDRLVGSGYVSEQDLSLFTLTDSPERAADELTGFYRVYHSMRYLRDVLILRLEHDLDDATLDRLNAGFGDLLVSGRIERCEPTSGEIADGDALDKARIKLAFDRSSFGRLRELIDAINA